MACLALHALLCPAPEHSCRSWCWRTVHSTGMLRSSTLFSTPTTSPASVLRSSDQLLEVVSLAAELLPPLPDAQTVIMRDLPTLPSEAPGARLCTRACQLLGGGRERVAALGQATAPCLWNGI